VQWPGRSKRPLQHRLGSRIQGPCHGRVKRSVAYPYLHALISYSGVDKVQPFSMRETGADWTNGRRFDADSAGIECDAFSNESEWLVTGSTAVVLSENAQLYHMARLQRGTGRQTFLKTWRARKSLSPQKGRFAAQ
jgi:hypothetical protein